MFCRNQETQWALPSVPFAGNNIGFYFIPPVGANVWIEFENGDRRLPVWSGCFWEIGQAPVTSNVYDQKVIKTDKTSIGISDTSGLEEGIRIETTSGLKIVMDSSGIN